MAAAAKKPTTPALRTVDGVDLSALDRVLTETAQQMAPMVSRTGSARERMVAEMKVLEADLDALKARRDLVERHYEALSTAFDAEEADIQLAIRMHRNALLDGAEHEGNAA